MLSEAVKGLQLQHSQVQAKRLNGRNARQSEQRHRGKDGQKTTKWENLPSCPPDCTRVGRNNMGWKAQDIVGRLVRREAGWSTESYDRSTQFRYRGVRGRDTTSIMKCNVLVDNHLPRMELQQFAISQTESPGPQESSSHLNLHQSQQQLYFDMGTNIESIRLIVFGIISTFVCYEFCLPTIKYNFPVRLVAIVLHLLKLG